MRPGEPGRRYPSLDPRHVFVLNGPPQPCGLPRSESPECLESLEQWGSDCLGQCQRSGLPEHGREVKVNRLTADPLADEFPDDDRINLQRSSGWRNPEERPAVRARQRMLGDRHVAFDRDDSPQPYLKIRKRGP